jgi:hypothetical protein
MLVTVMNHPNKKQSSFHPSPVGSAVCSKKIFFTNPYTWQAAEPTEGKRRHKKARRFFAVGCKILMNCFVSCATELRRRAGRKT